MVILRQVKLPFASRKLPYSQYEISKQIEQVNSLTGEERDIANEILKFYLDANVTYLKGK